MSNFARKLESIVVEYLEFALLLSLASVCLTSCWRL